MNKRTCFHIKPDLFSKFKERSPFMFGDFHGNSLWEVSLNVFQVCEGRASCQVLEVDVAVEGSDLVLDSVLGVDVDRLQQRFSQQVRLLVTPGGRDIHL